MGAPIWRTNYHYSVGNLEEIKEGNLERVLITEDTNFRELITQSSNLIFISSFVGVYQTREIINPRRDEVDEIEELEKEKIKIFSKFIRKFYEIEDKSHPYLIHLIYEGIPVDTLRQALDDKTRRITFSTPDRIPDFFDKDIEGWYKNQEAVFGEQGVNLDTNVELLDDNLINECFESSRGFREKYRNQYSLFGMTQEEYILTRP